MVHNAPVFRSTLNGRSRRAAVARARRTALCLALALLVVAATWGPASGRVLCFAEDGHVTFEAARAARTCTTDCAHHRPGEPGSPAAGAAPHACSHLPLGPSVSVTARHAHAPATFAILLPPASTPFSTEHPSAFLAARGAPPGARCATSLSSVVLRL